MVVGSMVWSLTSCDKTQEWVQLVSEKVDAVQGKAGSEDSADVCEVRDVDEQEAKAIISRERRLVMLEFYSDT